MERATVPRLGAPAAGYARAKRDAAARASAEAARRGAHAQAAAGQQAAFGPLPATFNGLNASGLSAAQQIAASGEDVSPPDTTGAIGPNNYVEMVNSEVSAYNKTTLAPVGSPVSLSTFTAGTSPCDPQIKYDPTTSRWFYVAIRCDNTASANELYLGFSKTSDPTNFSTAGWCRYIYSFGTNFEDYPKLGVDGTHIMVGVNEFQASSGAYQTAHIFAGAEPTAGAITTCPSTAPALTVFGTSGTPLITSVSGHEASTPEPATVADTSSPGGYVVAADEATPFSGNGSNIMVWQVTGSASPLTLTALGAPAVPAFSLPANIPQPGSTDKLDSSDSRLTAAIAANDPNAGEAIWTQHTVASGSGGTVVRWYEIVPGTPPTVRQTGSVTDPGGWAFNGAIAPTSDGGAVVNYDAGGPSQLVSVLAQSRIATAPLGTTNTPITLANSSAIDADFTCPSQGGTGVSCRWGDYAGASVDPTNGQVVWGTAELNGPNVLSSSQWATQNFALTNDIAPTAAFGFTPTAPVQGQPVAFDASSSTDADGTVTSYSWDFGDGSAFGTGAAPSHAYASPGTFTVTLTVTDNGGQRSQVAHQVTVSPVPQPGSGDEPPAASFVTTTRVPASGFPVSFNAAASSDPDGGVASYSWSFGDGSGAGSGVTPTHSYQKPGSYAVGLTVTDSSGLSASTTHMIIVALSGKITRVRVSKTKKGTFLLITVNAPGVLQIGKSTIHVPKATTVKFKIKLSSSQGKRLAKKHELKDKLTIKFLPAAGQLSTTSKTITFRHR
jgi:PKD repeat protein